MKVRSVTPLEHTLLQCDINTKTANFYVADKTGVQYLVHNSPAIIFGRDENGTFHFGDKYSKEIVDSGDNVYQQYVGRSGANVSDDRKQFAADMGALWNLYERATPKDFRGFIEGGLLYKTTPPLKNGEYVFQPNTVIYHVNQNSPLGKRIGASISGSAATAYFDNLPALGGRRITTDLSKIIQGIGNKDVVILPPKYATEVRAQIPREKLQQVKNFINSSAARIEKFITPSQEWIDTYPDVQTATKKWREVIYKYVNSQVDNPGGLESLGNNMAEWAETDPLLTKGRRPLAINKIKQDVSGMKATFLAVRAIMHLKDTVVDQIENKTLGSLGIRAELPGGVPGGEGFVSDPLGGSQPLKFVKRGTFTAANRQKGRIATKENVYRTNKIHKHSLNLEKFENKFGKLLKLENGKYRSNKITEKMFLQYASRHDIDPQIYYSALNEQIEKTCYNKNIVESINPQEETGLTQIFNKFSRIGDIESITRGDMISLLMMTAEDYGPRNRTISLEGFSKPKRVKSASPNLIIFEDGSRYPSEPVKQSRIWRQIQLFENSHNLNKSLTDMLLTLDKISSKNGDWTIGPVSIQENNKNNSEEDGKTAVDLKFNTVPINENQIYDYFKLKYKNYGSESFPQRMVSGIKKISETKEHTNIQPFIDKLIELDFSKKIKVGDKLAILDFEFVFAWKEIEVRGFTIPKTVSKIVNSGKKINYVEFEDGDRYPRQTPATYSGRPMEYAVYFKKSGSAEQALTMMSLMLPDDWEMNTSEVQLSSMTNESTDKTKDKTAVVGWGRGMGHRGHMFLAESVIDYANKIGGTPFFFVSETVGKDDPLDPKTKLAIYRTVFPKYRNIFHSGKTPISVIEEIYNQGYTDLVFIVGADQRDSFQFLARPTKSTGELPVPFDTVRVISRQETGSKTANLEGPRATPMREILRDPDVTQEEKFRVWRDSMPRALSDKQVQRLMTMAAKKMGVEMNLAEADPPPQTSVISPISSMPQSLKPKPSRAEVMAHRREIESLKRFMQGNGRGL